MDIWRSLRAAVLLGIGPALPGAAQTLAHFTPADGGAARALELRFVREGAGGVQAQPWPAREAGWLFVRQEGAQSNFDAFTPLAEDATRLRVELEAEGPALVGWDLAPHMERVRAAELRAFLAERAGARALPRELAALEADASVALARLESLTLVARAGTAGAGPSATPISKSGQRMELRALLDPGTLAPGSEFPFKLYLPAGGAENVYCRALQLESRASLLLELQPDGSLRARLEQPGPWMIEVQRLRALDGGGEATHELASATLVFVVRTAPAPKGGGR